MKPIVFLLFLSLPFTRWPASVPVEEGICLTPEESRLYDLIMDYRKSKKLNAIPFSSKLSKVAQVHVRDLVAHFDQANPNKCNPHSWSTNGKWTSCCYTPDHKSAQCMWDKPKEISGYSGAGFEIAYYSSAGATAAGGLEGWKKSSGHNPLLVNTGIWKDIQWNAIGVGIYGQYAVVWFGEVPDLSDRVPCR